MTWKDLDAEIGEIFAEAQEQGAVGGRIRADTLSVEFGRAKAKNPKLRYRAWYKANRDLVLLGQSNYYRDHKPEIAERAKAAYDAGERVERQKARAGEVACSECEQPFVPPFRRGKVPSTCSPSCVMARLDRLRRDRLAARPPKPKAPRAPKAAPPPLVKVSMRYITREAIEAALRRERGNVRRAARALGLYRNDLRRWIKKNRVDPASFS